MITLTVIRFFVDVAMRMSLWARTLHGPVVHGTQFGNLGGISGRGMSAAGTGRQYSIAAPDESEEQVRVINVVENRVVSGAAYEQGTPAKKRGNKSAANPYCALFVCDGRARRVARSWW